MRGQPSVSYTHLDVYKRQVLDVGQGESVALYSNGQAVLVDCGSANSYIDAGAVAADQLSAMGLHRLKAVSYTHLDVYKRQHSRWFYAIIQNRTN